MPPNSMPYPYALNDLLATKLEIPLIGTSIVTRRRLTELLKMGMERRLTLLTAPAGYGKTTLLAEWISGVLSPDWRIIWVTVDSFDSEPFRLWAYVTAALQKVYPRVHYDHQRMFQEHAGGSRFTALTPLINGITQIPYQLILVLDDYQWITSSSVHEELRYLLDHQPKNLHLLISSRVTPPIPLARLRAQRQLLEVTAKDLTFTRAEAQRFLSNVMKMDLDQDSTTALHVATEGWVAGLQLATLSLIGQPDRKSFIAHLPEKDHQIFAYLTEEVLDRLSPDVREFLLKTSILSELSAPLCDALLERNDSREMLDRIQQANLFIVPRDERHQWFSYHRLFSDTLQTYLSNTYPELIPELHRKACTWLQENGFPDRAVSHALEYGDLSLAAQIIDACAMQAIIRFDLDQLVQWISRFSDELIGQRPQLGIYYALANFLIEQMDKVEPKLQALEKILSQPGEKRLPAEDERLIRWEITALRVGLDGYLGLYESSIPAIKALIKDAPPQDVYFSGFLLHGLAQSYAMKGDLEAAIQAYEMGCKYATEHGLILEYSYSRAEMSHIRKVQGRLREAERGYQDMLSYAFRSGLPVDMVAMARTGLVDVAIEQNLLDRAGEHVQWVIDNLEQIEGCSISWLRREWLWLRLVKYYLARHDLDQALRFFDKAVEGYQANNLVIHYLSFHFMDVQVKIWAATGELCDKDLKVVERVEFFNPLGKPYPSGQAALARYSLAQGQTEKALSILSMLIPAMREIGKVERLMNAYILEALAYQKSGSLEQALQSLHQAIILAVPEGYRRIFLEEGEPMKILLEEYLRHPVGDEQSTWAACYHLASSLINDLGQKTLPVSNPVAEPQPTTSLVYPLFDPLSHRELEILQLMVAGKSTKEIASALMVSINTAKVHIKSIYRKTGAHTRPALLKRVKDLGLISVS